MSYDLVVFDLNSAPKNKVEFLKWYQNQTEWAEDHNYDDPIVTTTALKNWFIAISALFPPLNGSNQPDEQTLLQMEEDGSYLYLTEYSIGQTMIYAAFSWSVTQQAYRQVVSLAKQHGVGFFDASGNGEVYYQW